MMKEGTKLFAITLPILLRSLFGNNCHDLLTDQPSLFYIELTYLFEL